MMESSKIIKDNMITDNRPRECFQNTRKNDWSWMWTTTDRKFLVLGRNIGGEIEMLYMKEVKSVPE